MDEPVEPVVVLPNGSQLRPGSRVRVPKDLIWHPEVKANFERYGWRLKEGAQSFGSEVIEWPRRSA